MSADPVIYDILRDGIGFTPVALTLLWAGVAVALGAEIVRRRRHEGTPVGGGVAWLFLWLLIGGFGFGNVWVQHFRCRAWAAEGSGQVVEGVVTAYEPHKWIEKNPERLSVGGHTWTYSTSSLGAGGYRGTPSAKGRVRVGSRVRVTSREGSILKLQVLDASATTAAAPAVAPATVP